MSDKPDEQLVDLDEIVGDPPAGDALLDDVVSNDQSSAPGRAGSEASDESESADRSDESEDES